MISPGKRIGRRWHGWVSILGCEPPPGYVLALVHTLDIAIWLLRRYRLVTCVSGDTCARQEGGWQHEIGRTSAVGTRVQLITLVLLEAAQVTGAGSPRPSNLVARILSLCRIGRRLAHDGGSRAETSKIQDLEAKAKAAQRSAGRARRRKEGESSPVGAGPRVATQVKSQVEWGGPACVFSAVAALANSSLSPTSSRICWSQVLAVIWRGARWDRCRCSKYERRRPHVVCFNGCCS